MALKKEAPEFDPDDEVLLMEADTALDEAVSTRARSPKTSASARQHKHIDYTRALDATQLYLNEIGFSPLLSPAEEVHFARLAQRGEEPRGRDDAAAATEDGLDEDGPDLPGGERRVDGLALQRAEGGKPPALAQGLEHARPALLRAVGVVRPGAGDEGLRRRVEARRHGPLIGGSAPSRPARRGPGSPPPLR